MLQLSSCSACFHKLSHQRFPGLSGKGLTPLLQNICLAATGLRIPFPCIPVGEWTLQPREKPQPSSTTRSTFVPCLEAAHLHHLCHLELCASATSVPARVGQPPSADGQPPGSHQPLWFSSTTLSPPPACFPLLLEYSQIFSSLTDTALHSLAQPL